MQNKDIWNKVIKLSIKAAKRGDVPVGAVILYNNKIIAEGYNTREKNTDILGHAEINVIKKTQKKLKNWNLSDCTMYVSLKPCEMCWEIIKQSRISNVIYLVDKPKSKKGYHNVKLIEFEDIKLKSQYTKILSDFFKELREKNK